MQIVLFGVSERESVLELYQGIPWELLKADDIADIVRLNLVVALSHRGRLSE